MVRPDLLLRKMRNSDWPSVAEIYAQGIATGQATFETEVPEFGEWDRAHLPKPRLVASTGRRILGWAALGLVSQRNVYRGVAEVSVYISERNRGVGLGEALLGELIRRSEQEGIWTLQASIFPENVASLRLHEAHGFRRVGRRERIAYHLDRWRDVFLYERRSDEVGTDD
jgi:L-amino acid N-acyltransferase YncA